MDQQLDQPHDETPQERTDSAEQVAEPMPTTVPVYADGSRVLCADGQTLGEVVATYREHLIVERGAFFPTALFVPYTAIDQSGGGDIVLTVVSRDAFAQGWQSIPEDPPMPEPEPRPQRAASTRPAPSAAPAEPAAPSTPVPSPQPAPGIPLAVTRPAPSPPAPEYKEPAVEAQTTLPPPVPAQRDSSVSAPAVPVRSSVIAATPPLAAVPESSGDAPVNPAQVAPQEVPIGTIEAQAMAPDASVPPPVDLEGGPPSIVGIPGRRLTDAELWSLLEPKAGTAAPPAGDDGAATESTPEKDTSPESTS